MAPPHAPSSFSLLHYAWLARVLSPRSQHTMSQLVRRPVCFHSTQTIPRTHTHFTATRHLCCCNTASLLQDRGASDTSSSPWHLRESAYSLPSRRLLTDSNCHSVCPTGVGTVVRGQGSGFPCTGLQWTPSTAGQMGTQEQTTWPLTSLACLHPHSLTNNAYSALQR